LFGLLLGLAQFADVLAARGEEANDLDHDRFHSGIGLKQFGDAGCHRFPPRE
jgi:hypothetical protein